MKIVYILTRSDVIGGASVHLLDLACGMRDMGHEVTILVGGEGVFLKHAQMRGLQYFTLRHLVREIHLIKDVKGFWELRSALTRLNPDIIHLHSSKAGILGRLVGKSLSIPTAFTVHGWSFTEGVSEKRRILYRFLEKFMARFSDKVITVSEYDKQLALRFGVGSDDLLITVHNGMPELSLSSVVRLPQKTVRMIMVARFDSQKNQSALLEALAKIKPLAWSMEFVGDGPMLNKAKKLARQLGLADRVLFSGACDDVPARLETSDVFILISNWEGLPLTILEAMRSGLPVVASKVGGVPEAVYDGKTGFLVERDDNVGLVNAVTRLLESPQLREKFGQQGKIKFQNKFTFNKMLEETMGVYDAILKGRK